MRISLASMPVIACCMLTSTLYAATIQSFGIAPNNPLPGDLVTAFFQLDGTTPPDGQAGVWVDGVQQCQAIAAHGYFTCAFNVPHGGRFNYELRYLNSVGALTSSAHQAISGGLRIVKFQPETVQAGRSAIIFAKLDYFHPAAVPQPQGQIQIATLDGAHHCMIELPAQTHCQILFTQAGRYSLQAHYSGDASYPALASAISEIRVADPKLDYLIYANEAPLAPITPGSSRPGFSYYPSPVNSYGNWRITAQGETTDYSVGTAIPLFIWSPYHQNFLDPSRVFSTTQNNTYVVTTPRGEQSNFYAYGTIRALSLDHKALIQTELALSPLDNNQKSDWYLKSDNATNYEWLSKKADGAAIQFGVPEAIFGVPPVVFSNDTIVFNSFENGIVSDDNDGLIDTFIARSGRPTIRLPLPSNHSGAPTALKLNASSQQLLLSSYLALTPDDLDSQADTYLFDIDTLQYRRVFSFALNGAISTPFFARDGAIVGRNLANNSLVVQPVLGPSRELILSNTALSLPLAGISSLGQALLYDANGSQLSIDLNTGAQRLSFGAVKGDEAVLQTQLLASNESGSRLLTYKSSELMSLNSDGTGRSIFPATGVQSVRLDDDANYTAFSSYDALVPEDTNQVSDIYEWDQVHAQLRRLSLRPDGAQTTQSSHLLAYSRRAGIALVAMHSPDVPLANGGLNLARIDLFTGTVTPITGVPALTIQSYEYAMGASRNTRWVLIATDRGVARVDTQTGATLLLESLFGAAAEGVFAAAISDSGQQIVVTGYSNKQVHVRFLNLSTMSASNVYQTDENNVETRISADGRYALVGARTLFACEFNCPPNPPVPSKLFVLDLERGLQSEQIASVFDHNFDFSGDASKMVWAAFNGSGFNFYSPISAQTGDVTIRENPYFKLPSYTSITRTVPALPNLAQDFLVEAVVSHKQAGTAPSGIVRFDDGNGAQCDGELIAQGELAITRCRILPNAYGLRTRLLNAPASTAPLSISLSASYLGDRRYGASQTNRSVSVSKLTPIFRWLVDNPSVTPEVEIGIAIDALAGAAFTGTARITSSSTNPCYLSAVEIQAAKRCRFFLPNATSYLFRVTLDDAIYTLGTGSVLYLNVGMSDGLFANGFE